MRGYDLIEPFRIAYPGAKIYGFSSVEDMREPFMQAGADGFVLKDLYNPSTSIDELALVIKKGDVP